MNYSNNEKHTKEEKHQQDSDEKQDEARPIEKSDRLYSEYLNAFCSDY